MLIELQSHSTHSDGQLAPRDVVAEAAKAGVTTLALSDHDSVAGVPDADLKAILTPDQWDRWTKSNEYSNASNMWQNVQQFHKQRIHN